MSSRGIDGILCKTKDTVRVLQMNRGKITNWDRPIWTSNILLSEIPERMENIHDTILNLSTQGKLTQVTIKWFKSNDKIIEADKIYPERKKLIVNFYLSRNSMKLIVVPAKTKDEILAVGPDKNGKYLYPLILDVCEKMFVNVNVL